MRGLCLLALVSCGRAPEVALLKIRSDMQLTADQKAKCPSLPSKVSQISAKLIVEGMESTPCPLTVTASGDTLNVAGQCKGVPIGGRPLFRLVWFTVSPTVSKEIVLAESLGRADLTAPEESTVDVAFDPAVSANVRPKTKASATERSDTKDIFNCDRTGQNVCDSMSPVPPSTSTDADTCSNLEELCQGTLFTTKLDQCPPGPTP